MKTNVWLVCLVLLSIGFKSRAQEKGILFEKEGTLFEQAVKKATEEDKLIFMDCYTTWCGPCKMMSRDVFPLKEVGDFMNPRYVSLKIDMEKGEGIELRKKLEVNAFPTLIVFNSNGEELGRFLGASEGKEFIERVKKASIDNNSAELDKRFAAGERSEDFLLEYLNSLSGAYKREQCRVVAEALLEGKEASFADDERYADIFMKHISNPFYPAFIYTVEHPEKLIARYGENPVKMKMQSVWRNYPRTLLDEIDEKKEFDTQQFDEFLALMETYEVKDREEIRLSTLISLSEKQRDWNRYVQYLSEYNSNPNLDLSDLILCKWATPIVRECKEEHPRLELIKILQMRIDDLNSGRRQPQTRQGNMTLSGNLKQAMEFLVNELKNPQTQAQTSPN